MSPIHEIHRVCDELIVNGDSSVSTFYSFPIISHDPRENLYIASDASGNYMTVSAALNSFLYIFICLQYKISE